VQQGIGVYEGLMDELLAHMYLIINAKLLSVPLGNESCFVPDDLAFFVSLVLECISRRNYVCPRWGCNKIEGAQLFDL